MAHFHAMPACLAGEPTVRVKYGSVHSEGVKGATADFVCFHCPLVASAEAKSLRKHTNAV